MKRIQLSLLVLVLSLTFVSGALAESAWRTTFNNYYGTAGTRLSSCSVCHTSVPDLNPYGDDFLAAFSGNVTAALAAIEGLDSDSDGVSNKREIELLTFPGDPGDTAPTKPSTWGAIKELYKRM